MEPTWKSAPIENLITTMMGKDRRKTIQLGECMTCSCKDITISSFRDELSVKEYTISGMCQECQDKVFGSEKD